MFMMYCSMNSALALSLHVMRDGTDVLAAGALHAVAEIAAHAAARAVADGDPCRAARRGEKADIQSVVHVDIVSGTPRRG